MADDSGNWYMLAGLVAAAVFAVAILPRLGLGRILSDQEMSGYIVQVHSSLPGWRAT